MWLKFAYFGPGRKDYYINLFLARHNFYNTPGCELKLRFGEQEETLDLGDISCGVYTTPSQVRKRKRQSSDPKSKSGGGSDEAKLIPNNLDSSTVHVLSMEKPKRTIWSFFSITTFFSCAKRANGKGTKRLKNVLQKVCKILENR